MGTVTPFFAITGSASHLSPSWGELTHFIAEAAGSQGGRLARGHRARAQQGWDGDQAAALPAAFAACAVPVSRGQGLCCCAPIGEPAPRSAGGVGPDRGPSSSRPLFGQRYVHILGRRKLYHVVKYTGGSAELLFFVEGLRFPDEGFSGLVSIHVSLLEYMAEVGASAGRGSGGRRGSPWRKSRFGDLSAPTTRTHPPGPPSPTLGVLLTVPLPQDALRVFL